MEAAQSSGVSERAGGLRYSRHSPESTLLYQIVERHYPRLLETLGDCARSLPRHAILHRGRSPPRRVAHSFLSAGIRRRVWRSDKRFGHRGNKSTTGRRARAQYGWRAGQRLQERDLSTPRIYPLRTLVPPVRVRLTRQM